MKKLTLLLFSLGFVLFAQEANAQSSLSSDAAKDEYWGTAKGETRGSNANAVGQRAVGLDTRYNTYEGGERKSFEKRRIANSKRMKEILKKEEKMLKKRKRDKRRLRRQGLLQ
ncbi:hypothetical protein [Pontibacter akesuensis]|uniref:Uncharacterized protein n=1 Tax=Pontibacter akesuensis TaxID=388950 RepID=A0A1I7K9M1_9BACT|nr:hypothetical protein [Pontibacter akesuensis]GHA73927.1 hypothetical protein GCM10007389_29420 [Pontibacter akesuensis]SFU94143.1 hypothetical protein SAMN04487941_3566 [Pontibacter akesuensis]